MSAGTRRTFVVPSGFLFLRYGTTYARVKGTGDVVVQTGQAADGGRIEVLSGLEDGDVLVMPEAGR